MSYFFKKLFHQLRIRNKGKNNVICLPKKFDNKNALISIKGNNNRIEIDEGFTCHDKLSLRVEGNNNLIKIGKNFYCHTKCDLTFYAQNSQLLIHDDVHVYISMEIQSFGGRNNLLVEIGKKSTFMSTHITCFEDDSSVIIGEGCMFSYNTVLYNTDGHPIYNIDGDEPLNRAKTLRLGKHVWVAHSAVVLKNVELADNIIIGRNAVVTKSCNRKNCILGGLPAKIIKENVRWEGAFPRPGDRSEFKGSEAPVNDARQQVKPM